MIGHMKLRVGSFYSIKEDILQWKICSVCICVCIYIYIYICIYIYILIHRHCFIESQLFSVARHVRCSKLGLKVTLCQLDILPQSHCHSQRKWRNFLHITFYTYIISYQSAQFMRRAIAFQCMWYIYTYIIIHNVTDPSKWWNWITSGNRFCKPAVTNSV